MTVRNYKNLLDNIDHLHRQNVLSDKVYKMVYTLLRREPTNTNIILACSICQDKIIHKVCANKQYDKFIEVRTLIQSAEEIVKEVTK